jgi:hypothetical protein
MGAQNNDKTPVSIEPDWKWGTAEGSRDLDRRLDSRLTFLEKLQWLEEAETLSLQFQAAREKARQTGPAKTKGASLS